MNSSISPLRAHVSPAGQSGPLLDEAVATASPTHSSLTTTVMPAAAYGGHRTHTPPTQCTRSPRHVSPFSVLPSNGEASPPNRTHAVTVPGLPGGTGGKHAVSLSPHTAASAASHGAPMMGTPHTPPRPDGHGRPSAQAPPDAGSTHRRPGVRKHSTSARPHAPPGADRRTQPAAPHTRPRPQGCHGRASQHGPPGSPVAARGGCVGGGGGDGGARVAATVRAGAAGGGAADAQEFFGGAQRGGAGGVPRPAPADVPPAGGATPTRGAPVTTTGAPAPLVCGTRGGVRVSATDAAGGATGGLRGNGGTAFPAGGEGSGAPPPRGGDGGGAHPPPAHGRGGAAGVAAPAATPACPPATTEARTTSTAAAAAAEKVTAAAVVATRPTRGPRQRAMAVVFRVWWRYLGGVGTGRRGGEDAPPTPADRSTVTGRGGGGNDSRSGHTGRSVAAPSAGSGNGGRAGDGGHAASAPCHDAGGCPCRLHTAAAFPPPAAGGRPPQRGPRRPRRQRRRGGVGARGGPHPRTGRVHRGPLVGPLAPPFSRGDTSGRHGGRPVRRRRAPPRCAAVSMDTLKIIKKHPWLASIRSNVDPNPSAGAPPGAGNAPVAVNRERASAALLRRSLCRPTSPPRRPFLRPCSHQLLRPWASNRAWGCSSLRRGPVARSSKEGFAAGAPACSAPPTG